MKKLSKIAIAFGIMLFAGNTSFAQNTATADALALVVEPIGIVMVTDLDFGYIAVANVGTLALSPAASPVLTPTGGVTPVTGGTVTAAEFTVTGTDAATYAITLPSGATTISDAGGLNTMSVDTWASLPNATGLLTGGTETLYVGATLTVADAAQPAGQYSSSYSGGDGPFTVQVDYN